MLTCRWKIYANSHAPPKAIRIDRVSQLGEQFELEKAELKQTIRVQKELEWESFFSSKPSRQQLYEGNTNYIYRSQKCINQINPNVIHNTHKLINQWCIQSWGMKENLGWMPSFQFFYVLPFMAFRHSSTAGMNEEPQSRIGRIDPLVSLPPTGFLFSWLSHRGQGPPQAPHSKSRWDPM